LFCCLYLALESNLQRRPFAAPPRNQRTPRAGFSWYPPSLRPPTSIHLPRNRSIGRSGKDCIAMPRQTRKVYCKLGLKKALPCSGKCTIWEAVTARRPCRPAESSAWASTAIANWFGAWKKKLEKSSGGLALRTQTELLASEKGHAVPRPSM